MADWEWRRTGRRILVNVKVVTTAPDDSSYSGQVWLSDDSTPVIEVDLEANAMPTSDLESLVASRLSSRGAPMSITTNNGTTWTGFIKTLQDSEFSAGVGDRWNVSVTMVVGGAEDVNVV